MFKWFRAWHGDLIHLRWRIAARKAKISPAVMIATVVALIDHASQQTPRGSIRGFEPEILAELLDVEAEIIEAAIAQLKAQAFIKAERIADWDAKQPKREDDSRERVAKHRAKKRAESQVFETVDEIPYVTQANAPATPDSSKIETQTLDSLTSFESDSPDGESAKKEKAEPYGSDEPRVEKSDVSNLDVPPPARIPKTSVLQAEQRFWKEVLPAFQELAGPSKKAQQGLRLAAMKVIDLVAAEGERQPFIRINNIVETAMSKEKPGKYLWGTIRRMQEEQVERESYMKPDFPDEYGGEDYDRP